MCDLSETCEFNHEASADGINKTHSCRRYPPSVMMVPMQHPITGEVTPGYQSVFPGCDVVCGEFKEKPPSIVT